MTPAASPIETLKTQVTEVKDALNAGNPTHLELQKLRDICDPTNMELLKAQHNAETAKLHTLITTKLELLNALPTKTLEQQQAIDELQRASNTMSRFGVLQPVSTTGNEWVDALPNWAHKQVSWLQGYARDNPGQTIALAGVGAALLAYKALGWLWGGTKSVAGTVGGGIWSFAKNVLWYGGMAYGGYSLYNYVTGNNVSAAPPAPGAFETPSIAVGEDILGQNKSIKIDGVEVPVKIEGKLITVGGKKYSFKRELAFHEQAFLRTNDTELTPEITKSVWAANGLQIGGRVEYNEYPRGDWGVLNTSAAPTKRTREEEKVWTIAELNDIIRKMKNGDAEIKLGSKSAKFELVP